MAESIKNGPQFVKWLNPVIQAIKELGGSGRASEIVELVAKREKVPEEQQKSRLKSGGSRFNNQVYFARQYLVWAGILDSSQHGVWSFTDKGKSIKELPYENALKLVEEQQARFSSARKLKLTIKQNDEEAGEDNDELIAQYKIDVLSRLKKMSPKHFEHFTKRLLRESGFEKVEVTGGPKDKGLDGNGILKVNPFFSFRVVFQCKRYDEAVTSSEISKFRGSIPSSVDKGILITTGYFTSDAKSQAQEPSLKPVELIDGEQMVELMEKMKLGLKSTFTIDEDFFNDFEDGIK
jgi:restriction system protein